MGPCPKSIYLACSIFLITVKIYYSVCVHGSLHRYIILELCWEEDLLQLRDWSEHDILVSHYSSAKIKMLILISSMGQVAIMSRFGLVSR